jgi:Holliday junction resolvase-like predicted endonuclease
MLEKDVQKVIADNLKLRGYIVQEYIETPVGIIDLIYENNRGERILVEIKESSSIKHAIGQIISYARYRPSNKYVIIYFDRGEKRKNVSKITNNEVEIEKGQKIEYRHISEILDIKGLEELREKGWERSAKKVCSDKQSEQQESYTMITEHWRVEHNDILTRHW